MDGRTDEVTLELELEGHAFFSRLQFSQSRLAHRVCIKC